MMPRFFPAEDAPAYLSEVPVFENSGFFCHVPAGFWYLIASLPVGTDCVSDGGAAQPVGIAAFVGAPQLLQNFTPGVITAPHLIQTPGAGAAVGLPHPGQKAEPSSSELPQYLQNFAIDISSCQCRFIPCCKKVYLF